MRPVFSAIAVLVAVLLVLGSAPAAGTTVDSGRRTIWHAASSEAMSNPERGFYRYTATRFDGSSTGDAPLVEARLREWRNEDDVTLVYRVFYLDGHRSAALPHAVLASVGADLQTARRAGVKLIARFAYSEESDVDAPPHVVVGHIRQLAPVLNANADVLAFLQAGFIGRWGEWYYSRHFAHDASRPWDLSEQNWADRRTVLTTLLEELDPEIHVQLRYVSAHQRLLDVASASGRRVGIHNDCFLASDTDHGTFQNNAERSYLADLATGAPVGGETCASNGTRSRWPTAHAELGAFRWTYLNADYHRDVLTSWGPRGYGEAERRLGYRLRLISTTLPREVAAGGVMDMRFVVTNDGYAAPVSERPAYVVFTRGSDRVLVPLPADVRGLEPGVRHQVAVRVAAPSGAGTWAVGLWLPDGAESLRSDPAYAIRLANTGMWDATTGVNSLGARVVVR